MPVTARLSKLFYERLGEEVANELVDWFNAVDATYRADLRDLNELNFARFDAKMEQRLGELNARIDRLEGRFEQLRSDVRAQLADQRSELLKWMFLFWAGTVVPLAGLILALHRS
ncbi:MAG TPA: hypothetical protein VLB00_08425 [Gemmatimonadales bacterium]|nr:hypothetical protein [Gemmatimonadales bacterium]